MERDKLQQYTSTWLDLTNTLLNKRAQTQKRRMVLVIESSKTGRTNPWSLNSGEWLSLKSEGG